MRTLRQQANSSVLTRSGSHIVPKRTLVSTETGAILPRPQQSGFSFVKLMCTVIPFLWAGATMSKNAAAFLEENDIFVPDDDDD